MNINDELMQGAVAKAIMDTMTPETRAELIQEAIASLLEPKKQGSGYNSPTKSDLQVAFDDVLRAEAVRYATGVLAEDPDFKDKVKALWRDVVEKMFGDSLVYKDLVEKLATNIATALTNSRY